MHRLDPTPGTVTDVFSRDLPPLLTVDPGETVVVRSLDASGHLERQQAPGEERPKMFAARRGHCLTGPIAVRGAEPGMMLAVRLVSLRPGDWGWTVAAAKDNELNRRLGVAGGPPSWLLWELDADAMVGKNDRGLATSLAPFLGVIGLPPGDEGEHSTIPPRACGGNIDCRELVAGATLYLPVTVPGALLSVGDGHAAQGDGEVSGTAIECPMERVDLTLDVLPDLFGAPVTTPVARTPAGWVTMGVADDLDEAMAIALDAMLDVLAALHGIGRSDALALASVVVDLRVTQVVNQVVGVHAVLPWGAVR
jgi:acetamidase/formamidase